MQVKGGTYSIPKGNPCDAALPCQNGLSAGAIAGIVVGIIVSLAIVAGVMLWAQRDKVRRWRKR